MQETNKLLQALGILYSALVSIIFGMMIISFPVGAYVVFNSGIGNEINFEYPISGFDFFVGGLGLEIPITFELGDAFIVLWSIFVILFGISIFGPKKNFLGNLSSIMTHCAADSGSNYLVSVIKWFSILILISGIINFVQEEVGITTTPPSIDNHLLQFFYISIAPLIEELGFRVLLIGLPLFAMYSHRASIKYFFKSLWNPSENLAISSTKKGLILIVIVAIFFGVAHIISGEPWSSGKFTQATASGIIIGWVYFRHGLAPAILIHWATNYFIFSYVLVISDINAISVNAAFSHSLMNTLETIFVISGIVSCAILIANYVNSKKKNTLEI